MKNYKRDQIENIHIFVFTSHKFIFQPYFCKKNYNMKNCFNYGFSLL